MTVGDLHPSRVGRLVGARDWGGLARYAAARFGVRLHPDLAALIERRWRQQFDPTFPATGKPPWSGATWEMWLRVRLEELRAFKSFNRGVSTGSLHVTLHVFFIHLEETEEMLEVLRRPEPRRHLRQPLGASASKVFSTHLMPHPIDRVAARVAPPPRARVDG